MKQSFSRLFLILLVNNSKSLDKEIIVKDNFSLAQRYYQLGETSCSNGGAFLAKLLLDTVNDTVKCACI